MDVLANTDFPDWRTKCAIKSPTAGNILHIPREGGYLGRMYVDLGEVAAGRRPAACARRPMEEIIRRANEILHPYTLDVKEVAWHSVYEVGHRVTDKFDDVPAARAGIRTPRVFLTGDACHTHSAKAGQGMNVSMQDGFNLGWKLAHVLTGRAPGVPAGDLLGRAAGRSRRTSSTSTASGRADGHASPEEIARPAGSGELLRRDRRVPVPGS